MEKSPKSASILSLAIVGVLYGAPPALAAPFLGTAQGFSVLGASTLTQTGPTTLWGNIGVYPGTSITETGGSINLLSGTVHQADAVAKQAQVDATTGYNTLAGESSTGNLTGQDLGGHTLTPGVYKFDSSAQLTKTLTLNAEGLNNAFFVFQIGSTLTTASSSVVNVINGGTNDSVFWQVGSSATLGTGTLFAGNILADASITLNTGAQILCGRAIALTGAVTMDTNTISNNCTASAVAIGSGRTDSGSTGFSGIASGGGSGGTVPIPAAIYLVGSALTGVFGFARRKTGKGIQVKISGA